MWIDHILFTYLLAKKHLDCFQHLVIMTIFYISDNSLWKILKHTVNRHRPINQLQHLVLTSTTIVSSRPLLENMSLPSLTSSFKHMKFYSILISIHKILRSKSLKRYAVNISFWKVLYPICSAVPSSFCYFHVFFQNAYVRK